MLHFKSVELVFYLLDNLACITIDNMSIYSCQFPSQRALL